MVDSGSLKNHQGAVLGNRYRLERLLWSEWHSDTYEATPLLGSADEKLEGKVYRSCGDSEKLRNYRNRQKKRSHKRKLASFSYAGREWVIYRVEKDYEVPTKRVQCTEQANKARHNHDGDLAKSADTSYDLPGAKCLDDSQFHDLPPRDGLR